MLLGRACDDIRALFRKIALDRRVVERFHQSGVHAVNDRTRRARRGEHGEAAGDHKAFQALLLHGRDIGRRGRSLLARLRDHAEPPAVRMQQPGRHARKLHLHIARDEVDHGRSRSLVVHRRQFDLRHRLQQLCGEVTDRAASRRRIVDFARFCFRNGDELLHILHRQRRVHYECGGHVRDDSDRREVIHRVVVELLDHRRVDGVPRRHHDQRVAVGRSACGHFGANRATGAAAVVDDHLLPEGLAHLGREHAADDVGISARGEGNDHPDGPGRKLLGKN